MPFISVPLNDVKEPQAVPEGEYDLRIIDAEDTESKKGAPMTVVKIAIEGHEDAYPIRQYLMHPQEGDEFAQMRSLELKRFLECFNIPFDENGFNTEDFTGSTGRCLVIQEENEENGNIYNRLRLPRLKD